MHRKPPPTATKPAANANLASMHPGWRLQEGMRRQNAATVLKGSWSFRHKNARRREGGDLDKASKKVALASPLSWPPPMTKGFPRSRSTLRPQGHKND